MKKEIETYRGWAISFDTESENFYCHSDQYDREERKNSFSSAKKFIDEFIKDNIDFKPFFICPKPESWRSQEKLKIIGQRKDGSFIYEGKGGEKTKVSNMYEDDYIVYDQSFEKHFSLAGSIQKEIDELQMRKKNVLKNITGKTLKELKLELSGTVKNEAV